MKNDHLDVARLRAELLEAIEPEIPFEGWSEPAFRIAVKSVGMDPGLARVICPRGAIDLACDYHRAADRKALAEIRAADWSELKLRQKVAAAVRLRLGLVDPEFVRRAASAFALPQNAGAGAKLVWESADMIWTALGDTAEDANWYTKRAMLSGVFSATVLFWMGDESEDKAETWAFLDNRIADVMQIEKLKGRLMGLPGMKGLFAAVKPPRDCALPGASVPATEGKL